MPRSCVVLLCVSLLSLLAGCRLAEVDKPPPPSTAAVQAGFVSPTGTLPGVNPQEVSAFLGKVSAAYEVFCGFNPVADSACMSDATCRKCLAIERLAGAIGKIAASLDDSDGGAASGRSISGIDGVLYVESICKGWGSKASPDPAHGQVNFTAGFTGRGLDPVVWGTFEKCEQKVGGLKVRMDGDFTMQWDAKAVPLSAYTTIPVEVAFQGTIFNQDDGQPYDADLAIRQRLSGDGALQMYLNDAKHGSFVFSVNSSGVIVRGAAGAVRCGLEMDAGCSAGAAP